MNGNVNGDSSFEQNRAVQRQQEREQDQEREREQERERGQQNYNGGGDKLAAA